MCVFLVVFLVFEIVWWCCNDILYCSLLIGATRRLSLISFLARALSFLLFWLLYVLSVLWWIFVWGWNYWNLLLWCMCCGCYWCIVFLWWCVLLFCWLLGWVVWCFCSFVFGSVCCVYMLEWGCVYLYFYINFCGVG